MSCARGVNGNTSPKCPICGSTLEVFVVLSRSGQTLYRCQNLSCKAFVNDRIITAVDQETLEAYVTSYGDFRCAGAIRVLRVVERQVPPSMLCDVGCGAGWLLLEATRRGWRCVGIDLSPALLREAQRVCPQAGLVVMDVHRLAFGRPQFGAVCLMDVLEHVPDPLPVLRAVRNMLAPDGVLVVRVPDTDGVIQAIAHILGKYGWQSPLMRLYQAHWIGFNQQALLTALQRSGFAPLQLWRENSTTIALLRKKSWARNIGMRLAFGIVLFAQVLLRRQDEMVVIARPSQRN